MMWSFSPFLPDSSGWESRFVGAIASWEARESIAFGGVLCLGAGQHGGRGGDRYAHQEAKC